MKELYFVTSNQEKEKEVRALFKEKPINLIVDNFSLQEILSSDVEEIVKDEALKAFKRLGKPCVVEHGILKISALNNFPGGLSKVVWNTIGDRLCNFISESESRAALAVSAIAYCDGKGIKIYLGETKGTIAASACGDSQFYWDPIFIPEGSEKTYAEMGPSKKVEYSQARKAWDKFFEDFLD